MPTACGAIGSDYITRQYPEKTKTLEEYLSALPLHDDPNRNRGFLIQSLHKAQEAFGFLPESVQLLVASRLRLHLSEVYGVITFYSYFTDRPVGRHKIHVCTGTACFVKGATRILEEFKRHLYIEEGETTPNGEFSLGGLRCIGGCSLAPVVMVNGKVYGNVSTKMVLDIVGECV